MVVNDNYILRLILLKFCYFYWKQTLLNIFPNIVISCLPYGQNNLRGNSNMAEQRAPEPLFPTETLTQQYMNQPPLWEIQKPVKSFLYPRKVQNSHIEVRKFSWHSFTIIPPSRLNVMEETPSSWSLLADGKRNWTIHPMLWLFTQVTQGTAFCLAWI